MKDDFKRIKNDAASLREFLDLYMHLPLNDYYENKWLFNEVNRFHSNIGEALGRIESKLREGEASIRAANDIERG